METIDSTIGKEVEASISLEATIEMAIKEAIAMVKIDLSMEAKPITKLLKINNLSILNPSNS